MISIPDKKGVLFRCYACNQFKWNKHRRYFIFHSTEFVGGGILKILVEGENAGEIAKNAIEQKGYEARIKKILGE